MTNESLMTKPECATASVGLFSWGNLDFVILSSFVIGHFVIDFYQSLASEHATARGTSLSALDFLAGSGMMESVGDVFTN